MAQMAAASRVVDYFLVVGTGPRLRHIADHTQAAATSGDADKGTTRTYMDRLYRGEVLSRFPAADHASVPFPEGITMFCIPDSIQLTHSASELPILYYFAATQGNGQRLYGACLKFFERVPPASVAALIEEDRAAASRGSRTTAPSTTDSADREGNPLSRTAVEEMETEHSLSSNHDSQHDGDRDRDLSLTRKRRSRSPSPSNLLPRSAHGSDASSPATAPSSVSPPGTMTGMSTCSPSPPRPSRGAVKLDSFAPLLLSSHAGIAASIASATTTAPTKSLVTTSSTTIASSSPTSGGSGAPSPAALVNLPAVYAPKCLCILSSHPFLEQYRIFLTELYRISLTPSPLPLERFISNFCLEVPLPPPGQLRYRYTISNQLLDFARNPPNHPLRYMHSSEGNRASRILTLFELLDVENILFVLECILLEKRVLFLSVKLSLLTMVAEIFLHLMYPFTWPHVYIPLLPRALIDFLYAPMPFIIGMHHAYVKGHLHGEMLVDLVVVDLDRNKVHYSNNPHQLPHRASLSSPAAQAQAQAIFQGHVHHFLPSKDRKKLKAKLKPFQALLSRGTGPNVPNGAAPAAAAAARPPHQAYQLRVLDELDLAFPNAAHPDELESIEQYANLLAELALQEAEVPLAFFRCFVSMFKDYRECLIFPSAQDPAPDPCFKLADFVKKAGIASDEAALGFYTAFVKTQAFQSFCEERIYAADAPRASVSGGVPPRPSVSGGTSATSPSSPPPSSPSVLFFDESILAKRNRSVFMSRTKRHATPFLDDTRYELSRTITIPPPEACNLPPPIEVVVASPPSTGVGTRVTKTKPFMFEYETFPDRLDETLFWGERLRPPPTPHFSQIRRTASDAECEAGNEKACRPTPIATSSAPSILASKATSAHAGTTVGAGASGGAGGVSGSTSSLPVDPALLVESLWFFSLAATATSLRSGALLRQGLARLAQRVLGVVSARASAGPDWRSVGGLPIPPSEEVFLRMMRACGACSLPDLATDVFQDLMLQLAEFAVLQDRSRAQTTAMYTFLLGLHALVGDHRGLEGLTKLKKGSTMTPGMAAAVTRTTTAVGAPAAASSPTSAAAQTQQPPSSLTTPAVTIIVSNADAEAAAAGSMSPASRLASKRPSQLPLTNDGTLAGLNASSTANTITTPGGSRSRLLDLVSQAESSLFSSTASPRALQVDEAIQAFQRSFGGDLELTPSNSCPSCLTLLSFDDLVAGFSLTSENDATTLCTACQTRFVPRLAVRTTTTTNALTVGVTSPPSPLQPTDPLQVDYLPPLVLRKHLLRVLDARGPCALVSPSTTAASFRVTHASLFWSLIWSFVLHGLPVDFLTAADKYTEPPTPARRTRRRPMARKVRTKSNAATSSTGAATAAAAASSSAATGAVSSASPPAGSTVAPVRAPGLSDTALYRSSMSSRPDPGFRRRSDASSNSLPPNALFPTPWDPVDQPQASSDANHQHDSGSDLGSGSEAEEELDEYEEEEEDALSAELGSEFTAELPRSPLASARSPASDFSSDESNSAATDDAQAAAAAAMHATLLADQRARGASAVLSPSTSVGGESQSAPPATTTT